MDKDPLAMDDDVVDVPSSLPKESSNREESSSSSGSETSSSDTSSESSTSTLTEADPFDKLAAGDNDSDTRSSSSGSHDSNGTFSSSSDPDSDTPGSSKDLVKTKKKKALRLRMAADNCEKVSSSDADDEDEDSEEYEDTGSTDEEVVLVDPEQQDFIEVPRSKDEPAPSTRAINRIPKNLLVPFMALYKKQPEHIKQMIRLNVYKKRPIIRPPPLDLFLQKARKYKDAKNLERKKNIKKNRRMQPIPKAPSPECSPGSGTKKGKPSKVCLLNLKETDTQLIHVDYPGRVVNLEKVITTMGGMKTISQVFSNPNKKLPVRYRPEDPYCNASKAEAHPTVGLLIKVRRRKPKPKIVNPRDTKNVKTDTQPEIQILHVQSGTSGSSGNLSKSVVVDGVVYTKEDLIKEDKIFTKKAMQNQNKIISTLHTRQRIDLRTVPEHYYVNVPEDYEPKVDTKMQLETLGIVYRTYKFEGLCDFQYLPMKKTKEGMISVRDKVMPLIGKPGGESAYVGQDLLSGQADIERFLLPTFMSRIDRPQTIVQDQIFDDSVSEMDSPEEDEHSEDVITSSRLKRSVYTTTHSFQFDTNTHPIPTEPLEEALDDVCRRQLEGKSLQIIRECFEQKPIWAKTGLEFETHLSSLVMRFVLPCVSYFATNGPWRSLWIRLGYDPREDQSTFLYQSVDFRVPLCYKQYIDEGERDDDSSYVFRPTQLPPKFQMFYQICNLRCDEVDRLIEIASEKVENEELRYHKRYGWLKEGTLEYIRQVLIQYLEVMLEEIGKIPPYPVKKIFLPEGKLEPDEKLPTRPREVRKLRRVRVQTEQVLQESSNSPSKTPRSKERKKPKPVPPPSGTLQDLSLKDIHTFESLDDDDADKFGFVDETHCDSDMLEDEEEDSSSSEDEDDSNEEDLEPFEPELDDLDSVKVEVREWNETL